ncbi:hypothetical protein QBC34DRAFT_261387, partial [Podospora aff. communis PSN243]
NVQDIFTGTGTISVLNLTHITNIQTVSPATDRIGCLNAQGSFTLSDCAVFTRSDTFPEELSTSEGICSFWDRTAEEHTESYYGRDMFALACNERVGGLSEGERGPWYTINGFNHPFVCTGRIGCTFETKRAPENEGEVMPVWEYAYGAHQLWGTPGYLHVVLVWEPI